MVETSPILWELAATGVLLPQSTVMFLWCLKDLLTTPTAPFCPASLYRAPSATLKFRPKHIDEPPLPESRLCAPTLP